MKTASLPSEQASRARRRLRPSDQWPREVKVGSAVVKVYRTRHRDGSWLYCVNHYLDGKRNRQNFADADAALAEAGRTAGKIARAERHLLEVDSRDWRLYTLACEALQKLGVPIDVACREYADARELLGSTGLMTAARYYVKHHADQLSDRNIPELVEEFIAAKRTGGVQQRGLEDYRSRLGRFAKAFPCSISSVTTGQLQQFLDSLKVGPRTRKNFKTSLVTLFDFARSRRYLIRGIETEATHLDSIELPSTDIKVFTPKQFEKLIQAAGADLVPYLAIRAFAGIRDSEVNRLAWENIKFEENLIEVPAHAAKKTRGKLQRLRRLVPIQNNLAAWLLPYRGNKGTLCGYHNSERAARLLAARIGVKWIHNGLRHGFGSYRVAQTKNYPQVAYEMGNSVEVIKRCYDQVVTESEALKWFNIMPPSAAA